MGEPVSGRSRRGPARARLAPHWRTRFGSWVHSYTVPRLLRSLEAAEGFRLTRATVYHWVTGRSAPQPLRACALVRLSRGAVTLDDVFRHRLEVARAAARAERSSSAGGLPLAPAVQASARRGALAPGGDA